MASAKIPSKIVDGPNAAWDTADTFCQITLADTAVLAQGDPVSLYTGSLGPNAAVPVCEQVVLATATGAGPVFGVYQGATITNSTGASKTYTIQVRRSGYGVVNATAVTAGTAVNVGSNLIVSSAQIPAIAGTAAPFVTVGVALATGTSVAPGTALIPVPGSGSTTVLVNAYIDAGA